MKINDKNDSLERDLFYQLVLTSNKIMFPACLQKCLLNQHGMCKNIAKWSVNNRREARNNWKRSRLYVYIALYRMECNLSKAAQLSLTLSFRKSHEKCIGLLHLILDYYFSVNFKKEPFSPKVHSQHMEISLNFPRDGHTQALHKRNVNRGHQGIDISVQVKLCPARYIYAINIRWI